MLGSTVVLWDIDGTLTRSADIGVKAFVIAVEQATGAVWMPQRLDFGGRTDADIAARILESIELTDPDLVAPVLVALEAAYESLADELAAAVRVLPGVAGALSGVAAHGALQTVVTGNIRPVAAMKLAAGGLTEHLQLDLGGYGSDAHASRADLVRLALARVAASGAAVQPDAVWVIGDTPRDLDCARATGVRCALVGTGTFPVDDLRGLGADLVLDDLSDPSPLFDALASR